MPDIAQLKQEIDLHDLADRLGLERPGGKGNYRSPHHADKTPSLSISKDGKSFQDFSNDSQLARGSVVDFIMYVEDIMDVGDAMRRLHDIYGLDSDKPNEPKKDKTLIEWITDRSMAEAHRCTDYLVNKRGIARQVVERCIARRTLGFNDYASTKIEAGQVGHAGPGVAFIVRDRQGHPVAVDTRYLDPALNGGVKTNSQGEKYGNLWVPDPAKLKQCTHVVVVESAINALTVETYAGRNYTAVATRGTTNPGIDWSILRGKFVIICMDNDDPIEQGPQKGHRPGPEAAWRINEELTALGIPSLMVDQRTEEWDGINDLNDFACEHDKNTATVSTSKTRMALRRYESHLIPGLEGRMEEGAPWHRRRLSLPDHDFAVYWKFRVKPDFTTQIRMKTDANGDESEVPADVCGFRIAALSRVSIASVTSTMTGEADLQPRVVFAASVQSARHAQLLRRVMTDETLHNVDQWRKFGAIFSPAAFARMLSIWERATHIGARDAVNFVGLCWKNGKPALNEGGDCYFSEPEQQCPYHNLSFPSGTTRDARRVIEAYQETFKENAAAMLLVWGVGAQLKALLGFWPHMMLQADKGSGKSVLIKRLERTIGFTMFSGQSLQTEFRLLTSVSHTSHPVGWEELSARKQDVIDKACAILQENYQYTVTKRGSEMTEYLVSAPVLLAGEDVPVKTLLQKLVRTDITNKQGPLMPENLPRFPMREWILHLAQLGKSRVMEVFAGAESHCKSHSAAKAGDSGAARIIRNYAAVLTAWRLLADFAGIDKGQGGFVGAAIREMNNHVHETESEREPWVWIMDLVLGEIDRDAYMSPYKFETVEGVDCLVLRIPHVMQHISQTPALKDKWNSMPVKSDRVLKRQLERAGVIHKQDLERTMGKMRVPHCTALSIPQLNQYGLYPAVPDSDY